MCGRYNFTSAGALQQRFDIDGPLPELAPVYNVAPSLTMPVVVRHSPNSLQLARWGFLLIWAEGKPGARELINARDDNLLGSKTFRGPFAASRCIVPATGFYEWRRDGATKTPYHIRLTGDRLFGFAGLLFPHAGRHGVEGSAYVIITTSPNRLMEPIHDRMPAILSPDDEDLWLDPDVSDPDVLLRLLRPYPDGEMDAYPISPAVNSPRNNYADLIKPEVNSA